MSDTIHHFVRRTKKAGVPVLFVTSHDPVSARLSIARAALDYMKEGGLPGSCYLVVESTSSMYTFTLSPSGELVSKKTTNVSNPRENFIQGLVNNTADNDTVIMWLSSESLRSDSVQDSLWEMRDTFKQNGRTAVILTYPGDVPEHLLGLVIPYNVELPDRQRLGEIIDEICSGVGLKLSSINRGKAQDILAGLSEFPAEQSVALSLDRDPEGGIFLDLKRLWDYKKSYIKQVPGLSIVDLKLTYDDIGGLSEVKKRLTARLTNTKRPYGAVVWVDEIEKSVRQVSATSSETSDDQHKKLLEFIDPDNGVKAMLFIGHPGTGKSYLAQVTGPHFGIPALKFDLGGTKGHGLVGQAEASIRLALDTIRASTSGQVLLIATCNGISQLSPALLSRFRDIFFFDLPAQEELEKIWALYMKRFEIPSQEIPASMGWTPRDIRGCCERAFEEGCSLLEAATSVTPISETNRVEIEALQELAHGVYDSPSHPGKYEKSSYVGRKLSL